MTLLLFCFELIEVQVEICLHFARALSRNHNSKPGSSEKSLGYSSCHDNVLLYSTTFTCHENT